MALFRKKKKCREREKGPKWTPWGVTFGPFFNGTALAELQEVAFSAAAPSKERGQVSVVC